MKLLGVSFAVALGFLVLFVVAVMISSALESGTAGFLAVLAAMAVGLLWLFGLVDAARRGLDAERRDRERADALLAAVHAGELPVEEESLLLAKPAEVIHLSVPARLKEEVTHASYHGGGGGMSIGLGPVRVGGGSGSARRVTRTSTEVIDTGTLLLTSQRAVYMGRKQTLEFPYSKLIGFEVQQSRSLLLHLPNQKLRPIAVRRIHVELVVSVLEAVIERRNATEASVVSNRPG